MNDDQESNQNPMAEKQSVIEEVAEEKLEENKRIRKILQSVSSVPMKVAHYAADMSKTKWFAVLVVVILGLVLAKLCYDGYHPKNSSGAITVKTYDGTTLLKTDENGNVTYSIEEGKEIDE